MTLRLAEFLYWLAFWIAVMIVLLGLGAWIAGGEERWAGVAAFFVVAAGVWCLGRVALLLLGRK